MRILGIDQSTKNTGAGLIEVNKSEEVKYITHCFISRPKGLAYPESILYMVEHLRDLLPELAPDIVAVEAPKDNRGFRSTQIMTELLGAIKYSLMRAGYPFSEIPPSTVKKQVTGYGWSSKEEVAVETAKQLGLRVEDIAPAVYYQTGKKRGQVKEYILDGSDALAIALTLVPYTRSKGGALDFRPKG